MSDEDVFGSDFGSFDDFLADLKPGEHRPLSGILRYRQGASATNWLSPGAQKYVPGAWQMLIGSIGWTGAAATSGAKTMNFAVKFSSYPLVIISPIYTFPLFQDIRCMAAVSGTQSMDIWWWSAVNLTACNFNWLAMGPVGP